MSPQPATLASFFGWLVTVLIAQRESACLTRRRRVVQHHLRTPRRRAQSGRAASLSSWRSSGFKTRRLYHPRLRSSIGRAADPYSVGCGFNSRLRHQFRRVVLALGNRRPTCGVMLSQAGASHSRLHWSQECDPQWLRGSNPLAPTNEGIVQRQGLGLPNRRCRFNPGFPLHSYAPEAEADEARCLRSRYAIATSVLGGSSPSWCSIRPRSLVG